MLRWMRNLLGVLFVLAVAACGGSSGCSGCGTTPLAGGFPKANAIENAAQVRVTRPGLDFIAQNLPQLAVKLAGDGGGIVTFPIPKSTSTQTFLLVSVDITVCRNGPNAGSDPPQCIVEVNLAGMKLHVDAVTPHAIKITGTVPVRLRDLPMNAAFDFDIGLGNGGCDSNGVPKFDYKEFPVAIELPLVKETISPRDGYTKIDAENAVINVGITKDDVSVCNGGGCGFISGVCDAILNFVKDLAFNAIIGGVTDQLKGTLKTAFCTKPNPAASPTCPTGSHDDKGTCVYDAVQNDAGAPTCVPMELGTDGHLDLGAALQTFSPGTTGGLDFVLAAGSDMDPAPSKPADDVGYPGHTPNGISLGLLGGATPQPTSSCVPAFDNPKPTGIPIPDEMTRDALQPWPADDPTGPHVGIAIAGRFINYALGSVYSSGLLCLGLSTEQIPQLNSGLMSALIPSLKTLTFEKSAAPVAITVRPQTPPVVTLGGGTDVKKDPLLSVLLKTFAVDFYVYSEDRFVRAFTLTADVTVPVNLQTGKDPKTNPKGGILPVLGDLTLANATVTHSELLLTDDPTKMASALSSILQGFVGQALGSGLTPIDLSSALSSFGLNLTIPAGGIRKLHKGNDDFLGIFADLSVAPAGKLPKIGARIVGKTVHAEAMSLSTAKDELLPTLHVAIDEPDADAQGGVLEHTTWIDDGTHSAWARGAELWVKDRYLFLQGKHTLFVSSRIVGRPESESDEPTALPFTIDTLPPEVTVVLSPSGDTFAIHAWDFVASRDEMRARVRTTGDYGPWLSLDELSRIDVGSARSVDVEVRDEQMNVGRVSQPLIRGRTDSTLLPSGSGCGCSTPGTSAQGLLAPLAGLAVLLGLALRRRGSLRSRGPKAAALALASTVVLAAGAEGCSCGSSSGAYGTGCGSDCNKRCLDPQPTGLTGSYTSVAKAADGTVWVSAYSEEYVPPENEPQLYGDLVVGTYDDAQKRVAWVTIDGLPTRDPGTCPDSDPRTFRSGEADPGDDVGLYTSLALGPGDVPMVAYFDATHTALKFASCNGDCKNPKSWAIHTVSQKAGSDIGRFARLLVDEGKPIVAHLVMEPGEAGKVRSKVVLARAQSALPASAADWTMETLAIDEASPCRASLCDPSLVCVKSSATCQAKVPGCTPADCGGGAKACVTLAGAPSCQDILADASGESYPKAIGDFISIARGPSGLGLVVYDRVHGNLLGIRNVSGGWKTTILDGETGTRGKDAKDTGDDGIGASLVIDAQDSWHVSYVNGLNETLNYLSAPHGENPVREVVDDGDGAKVTGAVFTDGKHVVGDDSFVSIDDSGAVTILYQDATAGTLRQAIGSGGSPHSWALRVIAQPNKFGGFFPRRVPQSALVANFARAVDPATKEMAGDVYFVTP